MTKSKIKKDENGEKVCNLEITDVLLVHCNTFNNNYQQKSRVLCTLFPNKSFDQLLDISLKKFIFLKIFQNFHILKYGLQIKILFPKR